MHTSDDPSTDAKTDNKFPWSMQRLYTRTGINGNAQVPMSEQGMKMSSSSESTACVWMRASGAKRLFSELPASTRTRTGTREWKLSAAGACSGPRPQVALGERHSVPCNAPIGTVHCASSCWFMCITSSTPTGRHTSPMFQTIRTSDTEAHCE